MKANCKTCGKGFEKVGNTKTCSQACNPRSGPRRAGRAFPCIVCGSEFAKTGNRETCSAECREVRRAQMDQEWRSRPEFIQSERERARVRCKAKPPVLASCATCGAEYRKIRNRLTCSGPCREAFQKGEWQRRFNGHAAGLMMKPGQKASEAPPFPADIDRDAFGHWISGFSDGESTFQLRAQRDPGTGKAHPIALFRIALRADDSDVLALIQSYWGCGTLIRFQYKPSDTLNANPHATFSVLKVGDLFGVVIPHFERYPLMAKKRNDFMIWRQGVELMAAVQSRPLSYRPGRSRNRHGGTYPKWTAAERERFISLSELLRETRRYRDPVSC